MPPLTTFQAIQATHALPTGIAEAQVEGLSSTPLTSVDVVSSAAGGPSLADLISQRSAAAVSSSMPPPVFMTSVVVTPSPVATPLSSSANPCPCLTLPLAFSLHLKRKCL
ncbi:hypothetical protein Hanom_Chr11g01014071 [Helianthus anomalus]